MVIGFGAWKGQDEFASKLDPKPCPCGLWIISSECVRVLWKLWIHAEWAKSLCLFSISYPNNMFFVRWTEHPFPWDDWNIPRRIIFYNAVSPKEDTQGKGICFTGLYWPGSRDAMNGVCDTWSNYGRMLGNYI
jgi:hypothetical protein